jgi:hypothetical protein
MQRRLKKESSWEHSNSEQTGSNRCNPTSSIKCSPSQNWLTPVSPSLMIYLSETKIVGVLQAAFVLCAVQGISTPSHGIEEEVRTSWTLAFGSCLHQSSPAPVLLNVAATKPDVFVWLGYAIISSTRFFSIISLHSFPQRQPLQRYASRRRRPL